MCGGGEAGRRGRNKKKETEAFATVRGAFTHVPPTKPDKIGFHFFFFPHCAHQTRKKRGLYLRERQRGVEIEGGRRKGISLPPSKNKIISQREPFSNKNLEKISSPSHTPLFFSQYHALGLPLSLFIFKSFFFPLFFRFPPKLTFCPSPFPKPQQVATVLLHTPVVADNKRVIFL